MSNAKLGFQDDMKRLFAMFPSIVAYVDEVGRVGSLEQAASEAEARIGKAQKDFSQQSKDLEGIRSKHLAIIDDAKKAANVAKLDAQKILAEAAREHDKIIGAAKAQAQGIVAESAIVVDASQRQLNAVKGEIEIHRDALERARTERTQAEEELAETQLRKKQVEEAISLLKARL